MSRPGRLVAQAQEVQKKKAVIARWFSGLVRVPAGMAYSGRPLPNTSA
jgi:hypothetical protein